jgi:hypothetical protein
MGERQREPGRKHPARRLRSRATYESLFTHVLMMQSVSLRLSTFFT